MDISTKQMYSQTALSIIASLELIVFVNSFNNGRGLASFRISSCSGTKK